MTRDEMVARNDRIFEAWNAHDMDAYTNLHSEGCVLRDSPDMANANVGREAIRARSQRILDGFSDAKVERVSMCVDGDRMCTEWRFTGTHDGEFLGVPATGKHTENVGATCARLDAEGLIVEETLYWDAASFMRQVGALPAIAQASAAPARAPA
jgi:steroid delta-isomerase-like uncharacterized protein